MNPEDPEYENRIRSRMAQYANFVGLPKLARGNFATAPFLIGILLLFCALLFYYFAVLKIDYQRTRLLDLGPRPDAPEYFAQAKAMLHGEGPSIQIGYDRLPSVFPPGYPTLMLPWLKILPEADSILAPFRTNQTLGLLLLLAVFGFYAYLAMPLAGGFAALLLATLPGFFTFCRSSTSDVSAWVLVVLAFMFAYLGLKEERRWKVYLSAIFLGLSLNIRLQSFFFAPLLLAMAFFPVKGMRLRWFLHCAALAVVFALAASPMLVLNTIEFHSPFKTGAGYWYPPRPLFSLQYNPTSRSLPLFSLQYIPTSNAAMLWREFALRPNPFLSANIFGTGTVFVPPFVLLICAGFFFIRINRSVICLFLAGLSFFASIVSYWYSDGRYQLPLLILLVAVAVLPVTWAVKNPFVPKRMIAALGILVLFAAACLGYPSRSGYKTVETDRSQAWDALHFTIPPRRSLWFIAQRRFLGTFRRQPGIVLSDIDPVYLNALLPKPFVAAPIDQKHKRQWSPNWRYDRSQAAALVKRGLAQSLPVYALFVSAKEMDEKASRLPDLDGYYWSQVESGNDAAVLKLMPAAASGN
jgi:hypothetical protein